MNLDHNKLIVAILFIFGSLLVAASLAIDALTSR